MPHVVLLGDSIFDNAAYVSGGPDVVTQLRNMLSDSWEVTLCAVDGAVVSDVERQLPCIPTKTTHIILSVGGNDALSFVDILDKPASAVADVLDQLATMRQRFEQQYDQAIQQINEHKLPLIICTIYNGHFPDPRLQRLAQTALIVFNDVILQTACKYNLPFIELRQICNEPDDYANPIEPSVQGGHKIARAIRDKLL